VGEEALQAEVRRGVHRTDEIEHRLGREADPMHAGVDLHVHRAATTDTVHRPLDGGFPLVCVEGWRQPVLDRGLGGVGSDLGQQQDRGGDTSVA
jgi:hypothetical protein